METFFFGGGRKCKESMLQISVGGPWNFGVDPDTDPYLWLMDPAPDPDPTPDLDPTPDPTPFLIDFKDAKNIFFNAVHFFLELANRHIIFSLKNLTFCKNFVLNFNLRYTYTSKRYSVAGFFALSFRVRKHEETFWTPA